jgi:hypothetical protein
MDVKMQLPEKAGGAPRVHGRGAFLLMDGRFDSRSYIPANSSLKKNCMCCQDRRSAEGL